MTHRLLHAVACARHVAARPAVVIDQAHPHKGLQQALEEAVLAVWGAVVLRLR
jgi:hypothetical protein